MSRFARFGLLALWISTAVSAQQPQLQPAPTIDRLLEHVAEGRDLAQSEFSAIVSTDGAARLLRAAGCQAGSPRYNQAQSMAIILWDCAGREGRSSASAMVNLDQQRVTRIEVMSAVVVPVRSQ